MSFVFVGDDHAYVAAASSVSITPPSTVGLFYALVLSFSGVAAGSGPWVLNNSSNPGTNVIGTATGWKQACFQAPSATGVGIEIWVAVNGGVGPRVAQFAASETCQAAIGAWSGAYAPTGSINDGALRASTTAQVTGNTPASPAVVAVATDLIIPCGADLMASPGFGTPTGYTVRIDAHDNGFGSAEAAIADAVAAASGSTGAITWPGNAASSTTHGATATLAVRATGVVPTSTGLLLDFTYPTS